MSLSSLGQLASLDQDNKSDIIAIFDQVKQSKLAPKEQSTSSSMAPPKSKVVPALVKTGLLYGAKKGLKQLRQNGIPYIVNAVTLPSLGGIGRVVLPSTLQLVGDFVADLGKVYVTDQSKRAMSVLSEFVNNASQSIKAVLIRKKESRLIPHIQPEYPNIQDIPLGAGGYFIQFDMIDMIRFDAPYSQQTRPHQFQDIFIRRLNAYEGNLTTNDINRLALDVAYRMGYDEFSALNEYIHRNQSEHSQQLTVSNQSNRRYAVAEAAGWYLLKRVTVNVQKIGLNVAISFICPVGGGVIYSMVAPVAEFSSELLIDTLESYLSAREGGSMRNAMESTEQSLIGMARNSYDSLRIMRFSNPFRRSEQSSSSSSSSTPQIVELDDNEPVEKLSFKA